MNRQKTNPELLPHTLSAAGEQGWGRCYPGGQEGAEEFWFLGWLDATQLVQEVQDILGGLTLVFPQAPG